MAWTMKDKDLLLQGRTEAYRKGFEEGFEEAIKAFVVIAKELSIEQELVVQNLVENFGQSPEDAERKMIQYWEQ